VAERWRAGGGKNAELCYYDVVCRAKNAGVNPDFALWAWLHESGASNYEGFAPTKVEDFGIHTAPGVGDNNFDQQITYFLKYVGEGGGITHCVGDPKITAAASGTDAYWLAISSWYLNGNCDPNYKNSINGLSGFDYLAELKTTWSWINSGPLPSSTTITAEACGGGTTTTTEKVDTLGDVYICEYDSDIPSNMVPIVPLPTLDPSIKIPQGCPNGRPVVGGYITQGPYGKTCSHQNMANAVDFGVGAGTPIFATHDGIARVGSDPIYGNFVDITGICNGVEFTTRYAHMPEGGPTVSNNTVVKSGQKIGVVNNTGSSSGNHLHYDFRNYGAGGGSLPNISASIGSSVDLTGCCVDGPIPCP